MRGSRIRKLKFSERVTPVLSDTLRRGVYRILEMAGYRYDPSGDTTGFLPADRWAGWRNSEGVYVGQEPEEAIYVYARTERLALDEVLRRAAVIGCERLREQRQRRRHAQTIGPVTISDTITVSSADPVPAE